MAVTSSGLIGADTSSYHMPPQKSALEQASEFAQLRRQGQAIEQGDIGIDRAKLDLINQQWGAINKELLTLADDPAITKDKVVNKFNNFTRMFKIPQAMGQEFVSQIPDDPNQIRQYIKDTAVRGSQINEAVNLKFGQPGMVQAGGATVPVVSSPLFGIRQTGEPIQGGLTPAQRAEPKEWIDKNTGEKIQGTMEQYLVAVQSGRVANPPSQIAPMAPQSLPVVPGPTDPTMQIRPIPRPKPVAQVTIPSDVGTPLSGTSPLFEEGKKQLAADQDLATTKLTQVKPLLQALPLMDGLRTGPTTAGFTNIVAALKSNNIIPTDAKNDPTVIRQIVNKKLASYIATSPISQRSDAAQFLNQASNPDPSGQLNQALIKLTKDAIVLDRVQAARALTFQHPEAAKVFGFEGNTKDLSKYGAFRAAFPQAIDERAFTVDMMTPNEKAILAEEIKKMSPNARNKFKASLALAKKLGLVEPTASAEPPEAPINIPPTSVPTKTYSLPVQ